MHSLRYAMTVLGLGTILWLLPQVTSFAPAADEASPAADAKLQQRVEKLLRDLDADTRSVRLRAEKELLDLGPDVLPLLPAPELLRSPGIKGTVRQIRSALELRKARTSVLPSRVTRDGEQTLGVLLTSVAKQTGNALDVGSIERSALEKPLSVTFAKVSFWEAMDQIVDRADLRYAFDAGSRSLKLVSRSDGKARRELAFDDRGSFRLAIDSAQLRAIAGSEDRRQLRVEVSVAPEPRLRPLFLKYAAADVTAKSKDGTPLRSANPDAHYDLPLAGGGRRLEITLDFQAPKSNLPSEVAISGKLMVETAADSEQISFTNLSQSIGAARRRGGVTVTLERAKAHKTSDTASDIEIAVLVAYDTGGPAFESHRTWIFHNEVYLETKNGKRFSLNGEYDTSLQRDGIVGVQYHFQDVPGALDDYSFVYVAPTLIINVPVEFRFDAVPVSRKPATTE